MAELGSINPLDERLQQALHSIALQYGGTPPAQEAQAASPQTAPQVADPYAAVPAPAQTGPEGSPYGAYRQEGKPWTQMQFDPQGQFTGISGYRRPDSPVPAAPPQSAYTAMAGGQASPPPQQAAAPVAAPQQQQAARPQMAQLGPPPTPTTPQQALTYLSRTGFDTSNPAATHLVPEVQKYMNELALHDYTARLQLNEKISLINQHQARTELLDTQAEHARQKALMSGTPNDIATAKIAQDKARQARMAAAALLKASETGLKTAPGNKEAKPGWFGTSIGATSESPEHKQLTEDKTRALGVLRDITGGREDAPTAEPPTDAPPMEGARKAPDGNWYVEKDGKFFKVEP
jgi:hypothetical protein